MKSKIKKFRLRKDPMIKTRDEFLIEKKLNEIIDHLNSQDQEEENECECCKWDDIGYTHEPYCLLFKEVKDTTEDTEHIKAHKEYLATSKQDTPEEWETMFDNLFYSSPSDLCIDKGELKALVRQLLSERSFSKEELVWIRNCVKLYGEEIEINEENSKIENAIFEKVDRLLNLNNKRK